MKVLMAATATALAVALAPPIGMAAADRTFSDVDADGNLELNESEFEQVSRSAFDAWDLNGDQRLIEEEFYRGLFAAWDSDEDADIGEEEYRTGHSLWFGGEVEPDFAEISGGHNTMTRDELASGLAEADILAKAEMLSGFGAGEPGVGWAAFHTALFEVYDQDDDGMVTKDDFAAFEDTLVTNVDNGEQVAAIGQQDAVHAEVVALSEWRATELYADGISVEYLIDEAEVYGPGGDEIGSLENVVFSQDGRVLSIVAEVGGFWDIFDTHVNVPWDEADYLGDGLTIPVTEENVEDYSVFETGYLTATGAVTDTAVVEDDLATGPNAFRGTDLIGDYARIREDRDDDGLSSFGYVNDLIIRNDELAAVVVSPDPSFGLEGPYYAYPYYPNASALGPYYDMPYWEEQVAQAKPLDYDEFEE